MDRTQKEAFVGSLHSSLAGMQSVVVGHYRGLTVAQLTKLRVNARAAGGSAVKVSKNRLACLAFKETPFTSLNDLMKGPTVIVMSPDAIAAAKVTHTFAKDNEKFVILGGALGDKRLDAAGVTALAKMPSLNELRAKIAGLLCAPAQRTVTVLQAPAAGIARQIAQKPEKVA